MCGLHLILVLLFFLVKTGSGNQGGPCGDELRDISAFPGEDEYKKGSEIFNQAYADIKPAFIAFPETVQDIQKCLQCSNMHSVPCVAKSGGHSSAGYSTINGLTGNGFVISLAKMCGVDLGADTVLVQAGARWENVYDKLMKDGHQLVTGGLCPLVGVAGFTLGGGFSGLSRKYGMAVDNVVSMTMVTANGSGVVVANAASNSDLFWALRGGGGGNFGIVTDITFKIHPSTYPEYVLGSLSYEAGANSQQALSALAKMNPQLPQEVYLDILITSKQQLHVSPMFLGSAADTKAAIKPITDLATEASYINFSSYYSLAYVLAKRNGFTVPTSDKPQLLRGCVIKMNEPFVEKVFAVDIPEGCLLAFMHLGGAVAAISETETAYYHRSGDFDMYIPCGYTNEEQREIMLEFLNTFFQDLEHSGICIGNYVNDNDRDLLNWKEKYYSGNYQRLLEVKKEWNPIGSGSFHFPQEIDSLQTSSREPFHPHSDL